MVKDHLWIWAHDAAFYGSGSGLPGVAHVTSIEGAFFMGIPNVMFIRYQGIPEPPFEQYTVPFRSLRSFEWSLLNNSNETSHLGAGQEHVYRLAAKRPNMTGVIMDDFIMRPGGEATCGQQSDVSRGTQPQTTGALPRDSHRIDSDFMADR
jgi:hypothetical protein